MREGKHAKTYRRIVRGSSADVAFSGGTGVETLHAKQIRALAYRGLGAKRIMLAAVLGVLDKRRVPRYGAEYRFDLLAGTAFVGVQVDHYDAHGHRDTA